MKDQNWPTKQDAKDNLTSTQSVPPLNNISFQTGDILQDWKDATVSLSMKKGAKTSPINYRSISLLLMTSKIQENIIYSHLYKHISSYLTPHLFSFCQHDGTELRLARLVYQILVARVSKESVLAYFFNLRKAFDGVWHKVLPSSFTMESQDSALVIDSCTSSS